MKMTEEEEKAREDLKDIEEEINALQKEKQKILEKLGITDQGTQQTGETQAAEQITAYDIPFSPWKAVLVGPSTEDMPDGFWKIGDKYYQVTAGLLNEIVPLHY